MHKEQPDVELISFRELSVAQTFQYVMGKKLMATLPVFIKLTDALVLNLASGAIFAPVSVDELVTLGPQHAPRSPYWLR